MKLAQSLALITGSASFVVPFALADIYVSGYVKTNSIGFTHSSGSLFAIPKDFDPCDCASKGDCAPKVLDGGGKEVKKLPNNFFSVDSGLCGLGKLNFYQEKDGSGKYYLDGGNGTLLGNCNSTMDNRGCTYSGVFSKTFVQHQLSCTSDISGCK